MATPPDYTLYTLPNGLRVLHKQVTTTALGHCAFFVNRGSRHETEAEYGMAHFLEHMLFKGTARRNAYFILNRLDSVGGDLNAYTTKELTVLHASFLDEHLARATDLLTDVTFGARFPEKEIDKERGVIMEEIAGYRDDPQESLLDDFEEALFAGHPLAHNILGTEQSLEGFSRQRVLEFHQAGYTPANMVFAYVGPRSLVAFRRLLDGILGAPASGPSLPVENVPEGVALNAPMGHKLETTPHSQTHVMSGAVGYPAQHPRTYALWLLSNLLGGDAMNSRLNLNVRERYGMVYAIESTFSNFRDSGLWGVFYSCDKAQSGRVLQLVNRELHTLMTRPLGKLQLHKAQQQLTTRVLMAEESRASLMLALGRTTLERGEPDSLADILQKVNALTPMDLMETANEIFDPARRFTLEFRGEG